MNHSNSSKNWQEKVFGPRLPWAARPPRPAEVADHLCSLVLSSENLLEDAQYNKIIPNQYIVEINHEHYARYYQPIELQVLKQWKAQMLDYLNTANSRQGRREYRFAGSLQVEIRPVKDLAASQVRVLSRFHSGESAPQRDATLPACLELIGGGRRWPIKPGIVTLGRDRSCDITLDMPVVQEKRLVSSQHAYMRCERDMYRIFDGTPHGKPSLNGTYVNNQPVPQTGYLLQDGDTVILAAIDPAHPRPDTPGVVALRFHLECP